MKRLMIVDAFNQFIRGYIVDPSKNPNGQPIGGIRTFINILNKITREIRPDMIAVVWDGRGGQSIRTTKQAENLLAQTGTKLVWKRMRSRTTKSGSR
jgi:5'-3' exonuclease